SSFGAPAASEARRAITPTRPSLQTALRCAASATIRSAPTQRTSSKPRPTGRRCRRMSVRGAGRRPIVTTHAPGPRSKPRRRRRYRATVGVPIAAIAKRTATGRMTTAAAVRPHTAATTRTRTTYTRPRRIVRSTRRTIDRPDCRLPELAIPPAARVWYAARHERIHFRGHRDIRRGASRRHSLAARRNPYAGLHAGRHRGNRQGDAAAIGARDRCGHTSRQYLSSYAASGRGAHRAARPSAQINALASPHPHRLGRLSGDVARGPAQAHGG